MIEAMACGTQRFGARSDRECEVAPIRRTARRRD
jgi:hypothetical protein